MSQMLSGLGADDAQDNDLDGIAVSALGMLGSVVASQPAYAASSTTDAT
jgi:hypothetical protein